MTCDLEVTGALKAPTENIAGCRECQIYLACNNFDFEGAVTRLPSIPVAL